MKTEIKKAFRWGFLLNEQECRRIVQACQEHALKISHAVVDPRFKVVLEDGSVLETRAIDEVFTVENAGAKRVCEFSYECGSTVTEPQPWCISFTFMDAALQPKSWDSIVFKITSDSRDWAFVAASDLEERIKRSKMISWQALINQRLSSLLVPVLGMIIVASVLPTLVDENHGERLKALYESGKLANATEALIALESMKDHQNQSRVMLGMLLAFAVPVGLFIVLGKLLPILRPSYNFYWGDYVARYDRMTKVRGVIWTVVVLGFVVGVAVTIFTKRLGL